MDSLQCDKTTSYLCRIYIDLYLTSGNPISVDNLQLLGITAIIVAIEINQNFQYPLQYGVLAANSQYTITQIIQFKQKLLFTLNFKFKYTTPYCYLNKIKQLIPYHNPQFYQNLENLIHYCCFLRPFANRSSGEIFFGCYLFLSQNQIPSNFKQIIDNQSKKFENVGKIVSQLQKYHLKDNHQNDEQLASITIILQ